MADFIIGYLLIGVGFQIGTAVADTQGKGQFGPRYLFGAVVFVVAWPFAIFSVQRDVAERVTAMMQVEAYLRKKSLEEES